MGGWGGWVGWVGGWVALSREGCNDTRGGVPSSSSAPSAYFGICTCCSIHALAAGPHIGGPHTHVRLKECCVANSKVEALRPCVLGLSQAARHVLCMIAMNMLKGSGKSIWALPLVCHPFEFIAIYYAVGTTIWWLTEGNA
jgi:hypothetical protein